MVELTRRQAEVLTFIKAYKRLHGKGPTYREIADRIGVSSISNVHRLIYGLVKRGAIFKTPGRYRDYHIVSEVSNAA